MGFVASLKMKEILTMLAMFLALLRSADGGVSNDTCANFCKKDENNNLLCNFESSNQALHLSSDCFRGAEIAYIKNAANLTIDYRECMNFTIKYSNVYFSGNEVQQCTNTNMSLVNSSVNVIPSSVMKLRAVHSKIGVLYVNSLLEGELINSQVKLDGVSERPFNLTMTYSNVSSTCQLRIVKDSVFALNSSTFNSKFYQEKVLKESDLEENQMTIDCLLSSRGSPLFFQTMGQAVFLLFFSLSLHFYIQFQN